MSAAAEIAPPPARLNALPLDQTRGSQAMRAVIATESMLFVCMFGAYYYLGAGQNRWLVNPAPTLTYPFWLLAILLLSSAVLVWGQRQLQAGHAGAARRALWLTVVLGLGFLGLQAMEFVSHLRHLTPDSSSYGSIFYTITSLHTLHVVVGLLLLAYVGILPRYGLSAGSPHRPYETAALYWHFVDVVWIFIVVLLYVVAHFQGMAYAH